ncbi:MAG: outer membrane protein [Acidiferrobacter sp.]
MKRLLWLVLCAGVCVGAPAVALASPWTVGVQIGSAIPADAGSGGQSAVAVVSAACGCTVSGTADTREPFLGAAATYRLTRWIAVRGSIFGARRFAEDVSLSGGGRTGGGYLHDTLIGGTVMALAHHRFARRWSWSAGAGLAVTSDSETGGVSIAGGPSATFPADATTSVGGAFAVGVHYAFTRRWSAGVGYLEITNVGSSGNQYTAGPLGLASFAVRYHL